ncbi:MAG: peptide-binding protein [Desulfovibrio sp.]|nr:peptide-binding protein [Desulfovibrio sp.]MBI4961335.1 peptide-binding protein [Desulfovibrio sp.]
MHFQKQSKHFSLSRGIVKVFGALFCLFPLFFWGCESPKQPAPSNQPVQNGQDSQIPEHGGRIIMATLGEPSNLIPPLSTDSASHEVASLIYVSPLRYDKNIKIEPYAAESFEIRDDGKHLLFKLREGIRWFDGTELTAEDVEFTYKLMIDPKTPTAYAGDFLAIKEFRLTGKYTFEVFYDKPFARAVSTWAQDILPKHALTNEDLTNTKYARQPMGAGPYMLSQWVENQRVILKANPDYFEGKPYIDEVVYRSVPDQTTQFMELKAGNLDYIGLTPPQYLFLTGGPKWEQGFRKYKYLASAYTYLAYNLEHPLFKERKARQALAHAVGKEEIVKGALMGLGQPTIGHYKPDSWAYNHAIADYEYDPGKALMMLSELGWKRETPTGPLKKDGKAFAFTIITNQGNDQRIKTCAIIQNQLARIGIEVKVRTIEWATFIKEFVDLRRFEAIVLGWTIPQDPDAFDVWHSSKAAKPGLNFVGYANAEADALLEQGRNMVDPVRRKPLYDRFQEILHEDQPYCFLYTPYALPIITERVHGVEPAPAGISWNFVRWWIPKSQQRNAYSQ